MSRAKKNRTVSENRAISQKIDELRMQGLNKERATAAAFRMFREDQLTIKIDNVRAVPKKTKQQVSIEKAVNAAATLLRKKAEQNKKRVKRAEQLAREAQEEQEQTISNPRRRRQR